MAKDDYEVIVYRILVYYYGCLKRKILFDEVTFQASVRKNVESETYFNDILNMMQVEGLIEGLSFTKAWGGDLILLSDMSDTKITAAGVRYLKENAAMQRAGNALKESVDIIAKLAGMLMI